MKDRSAKARFKSIKGSIISLVSVGLISCGAALENNLSETTQPEPAAAISLQESQPTFFQHKCVLVSDLLETQITKLVDETWGREYCASRSGVKTETTEIILVTIEGACRGNRAKHKGSCGNQYQRYMLGIKDGDVIATKAVSKTYVFQAGGVNFDGTDVILSGKGYTDTDAKCCPSLSESREYKIVDTSFVEAF